MMKLHWSTSRVLGALLWWAMVFAGWPAGSASASVAKVTAVAVHRAGGNLQVTITTSRPAQYRQRPVRPDWVVVDVLGAQLGLRSGRVARGEGLIARIRVGQYEPDVARVVIELTRPVPVRLHVLPDGTAAVVRIPSRGAAPATAWPSGWPECGPGAPLFGPCDSPAGIATVTDVNVRPTPQGAQVLISASGPVRYIQRNVMPTWVVLDLENAELVRGARISKPGRDPVDRVRASRFGRGVVQVVVELSRPIPVEVTTSTDEATITVDLSTNRGTQAQAPPPSVAPAPSAAPSGQPPAGLGPLEALTGHPPAATPAGAPSTPEPPLVAAAGPGSPAPQAAPSPQAAPPRAAPPQAPAAQALPPRPAPARPAATEYRLGPDDVLEVTVWGYPDLTRIVTVRPDGLIAVPLAGTVPASGRSVERLSQDLTRAFARYIIHPQVTVIVKEFRKLRVSVLGHVAHPGTFALEPGARILDALSMASGVTDDAALTQARLVRASGETRPLNLEGLLVAQDMSQNLAVEAGDTIIVPEDTKNKYYVLGDVNRPGSYPLKGDVTVLEALANAGGPVMHGASSATSVHIVRRLGANEVPLTASARAGDSQPIANGRGVLISKDLKRMYNGDLQQNEALRPGDVVVVPAPGIAALPTILGIIGTFFWGIHP